MIKMKLVICNELGLHTRAASKLVNTSLHFSSEITITVLSSLITANCKSIMGLMMLGAGCGTSVEINVSGEDEEVASAAIKTLIESKFGENS